MPLATKRYHLIIDLQGVDNQKLNDQELMINFLKELPGVINMHVLKGPELAVGIPENPGISGFVIIDYSHISVHTFTKNSEALIDIFSCKPYDQETAIKFTLENFGVERDAATLQVVSWG